jgi:purine nucleosidase
MSTPVLIDTDPGCDDALGILLALKNPSVDVVGLTTVHGNSSVNNTTRNARSILELFDRDDIPIAVGAETPFLVDLITAEHVHGEDGIKGDLPKPTNASEPIDVHAVQFIINKAKEHDGDLVLAALGPLTNVAMALALEPNLPSLLDELVIMGGAAFTRGNVSPLAEANFYSDPEAAHKVVTDADATVVSLDVTLQATLPSEWIKSLDVDNKISQTVHQWLDYYDPESLKKYDIETAAMHDALAIAGIINKELFAVEYYDMMVGNSSEIDRGVLVCESHSPETDSSGGAVVVEADIDQFRELVIQTVERTISNQ